jgi:hypothetical protein
MEHIIHSTVMKNLDMHGILVNAQHGFHKSQSCESQIIMTVHDLANSPNRNEPVDGMLLYFSKALIKGYWKSSAIIKFVDTCTVELRIS